MPIGQDAAARVTEIVELLRPERSRKLPETLTAAAMNGDLERMQLFLDRGADIEERSVGFASPLSAACAAGRLESLHWLIAHGARLDPPVINASPIQSALGQMNCQVAAVLLDAGLPVENAAWGVVAAASTGRPDVVLWLLGRGLELDRSYPGIGVLRERALAAAEKAGSGDLASFFRGGLSLDPPPAQPPAPPAPRSAPVRPIAPPARRPRLLAEALELLRTHGKVAGQWRATGQRMSLISYAAGNGVGEIVVALYDAGAALDFPNDGTPPPLARAAAEAHHDVVRILLERGASPNGYDGKTWHPLEAALMSGDPQVVCALLDAGARPKAGFANSVRGPYAQEILGLLEQTVASAKATSTAKTGKKK